jgi:hypothetical protein
LPRSSCQPASDAGFRISEGQRATLREAECNRLQPFSYSRSRAIPLAAEPHYGADVSRPAKVVAALILVGAVGLAIAGYFAASGSDEAYWAPLVPVFVLIYAALAVGVVAGLDYAIRWGIQRHRARLARPS